MDQLAPNYWSKTNSIGTVTCFLQSYVFPNYESQQSDEACKACEEEEEILAQLYHDLLHLVHLHDLFKGLNLQLWKPNPPLTLRN